MKIEDFSKTIDELEKQKKHNNKQAYISEERFKIAKANQFEYKATATLAFSMISYLFLFVSSAILINTIGINTFTSIFPGFSFPITLLGSSLGMGAIIRTLMYKRYKTKERLKVFSEAKTQADKLEEEIKYQIELEKTNNRNYVLNQALTILNSNQAILKNMSNRYIIKDKNDPQNEEEAKQKIEELNALLKEKYNDLELTTTQKVLHDRFWRTRTKWQKNLDTMLASLMSCIIPVFFTSFALMLIRVSTHYPSLFSNLLTIFTPAIIGIVGINGYMIKRNRDYHTTFNHLNTQLKENAIADNIDNPYNEQQELKNLIERLTKEISNAEVQLKEYQRALERIIIESEKQRQKIDSKEMDQTLALYTGDDAKTYQQKTSSIPNELFDETQPDVVQESGHKLLKKTLHNPNDSNK